MKKSILVTILALLILSLSTSVFASLNVGDDFPSLKVKDLGGNIIDVGEMKGKLYLIDIWASWCGPCRSSMPHNQELYEKYKDKGFEIVAINIEGDTDNVIKFAKDNGLTFNFLIDSGNWESESIKTLGIEGIPQAYLVDKDGIIRFTGHPMNIDDEIIKKNLPNSAKKFPSLKVKDMNGNTVDISEYKGKLYLIDIWATWCGPCRSSMPHNQELYDKYKDKGFEVIAINIEGNETKVNNFATVNKLTFTILMDSGNWDSNTVKTLNIEGIPQAYLVDENGNILFEGHPSDITDEMIEKSLPKKEEEYILSDYIKSAIQKIQEGSLEASVILLQEAIKINNQDVESYMLLIKNLELLGRSDEADKILLLALEKVDIDKFILMTVYVNRLISANKVDKAKIMINTIISSIDFFRPEEDYKDKEVINQIIQMYKTKLAIAYGNKAPDFVSYNLHATNWIDSSQYRGKVLVLHFWSQWAKKSQVTLPYFQKLHEKYNNKGLVVLGIDYGNFDIEPTMGMIDKFKITFENIFDIDYIEKDNYKSLSIDYYGIDEVPFTVLIDNSGIIRYVGDGLDLTTNMIEKYLPKSTELPK